MDDQKEKINYSSSEYKKAQKILKIYSDCADDYKNPTHDEIIEYIVKIKKEKRCLPNLKEIEKIINDLNEKDKRNLDAKNEIISMSIYGTDDNRLLSATTKLFIQEEIELKKKIERRKRY